MTNKEYLNWLYERLVNVYNENPSLDFVRKLREIADTCPENKENLLYVIVDSKDGKPILGGGSSTKSHVRAFVTDGEARRSKAGFRDYHKTPEIAVYGRIK